MREELSQLDGERMKWRGVFVRLGRKQYRDHLPQPTVLLRKIEDCAGNPVADHLWFNLTKEFIALDLKEGDRVEFEARVKRYKKRNRDIDSQDDQDSTYVSRWAFDWKLANPTRVRKLVAEQQIEELPLFKNSGQSLVVGGQ